MATSGSSDFSITRDNIIEDALSELGIFREGSSISGSEYTNTVIYSARALNRMIKGWVAQGTHIWTRTEATVFFDKETETYSLGTSGDESAENDDGLVETTLSAAEASGQTVLSLTTVTGMSTSDVILIEMDDGTMHSTTISSIDTSAVTVTIGTATDDAAASGNAVYSYTTVLERPLRIIDARLRDEDNLDRAMTRLSHSEYHEINDKFTDGTPTSYYYDAQLATGKLHIWPRPDNLKERLKITYYRLIEDFDAAGDNPDFPIEWADALVLGLASRLARAYGKDQKLISSLKLDAELALQGVLEYDADSSSLFSFPQFD